MVTLPNLQSNPRAHTANSSASSSPNIQKLQRALQLPRPEAFQLLAQTFQALADPTRVKIVWLLAKKASRVGELAQIMGMSQPAVSHHLRTLRNLRLVRVVREGRTASYSLDDEHIEVLLREGLIHVEDLL